MAKGYWIVHVTVNNVEDYPTYVAAASEALAPYNARFLARGGKSDVVEGISRDRHVVIEFESYDKAVECYNTPDYKAAIALRQKFADSELIIVEGVD